MITLPWPDHRLSSNSREDRRALTAIRREARALGFYTARAEQPELPDGPLEMWLTFYPPDARRRDLDGLLSAFKSYQDGIFLALERDDSCVKRVHIFIGARAPGGRVEVELKGIA